MHRFSSSSKHEGKRNRKGERLVKGNGRGRRAPSGERAVVRDGVALLEVNLELVGRLLIALDAGLREDAELPGAAVRGDRVQTAGCR